MNQPKEATLSASQRVRRGVAGRLAALSDDNYVDGLDNTFTRRSCIDQRFKFRQANNDIAEKYDLARELSDISGVQHRNKSVSETVRTAPSMNLKDTG